LGCAVWSDDGRCILIWRLQAEADGQGVASARRGGPGHAVGEMGDVLGEARPQGPHHVEGVFVRNAELPACVRDLDLLPLGSCRGLLSDDDQPRLRGGADQEGVRTVEEVR
jgi:hypothetical protein